MIHFLLKLQQLSIVCSVTEFPRNNFAFIYFIIAAQNIRPVYQIGELIDSYERNLTALVQHSSNRSIFYSIDHNRSHIDIVQSAGVSG